MRLLVDRTGWKTLGHRQRSQPVPEQQLRRLLRSLWCHWILIRLEYVSLDLTKILDFFNPWLISVNQILFWNPRISTQNLLCYFNIFVPCVITVIVGDLRFHKISLLVCCVCVFENFMAWCVLRPSRLLDKHVLFLLSAVRFSDHIFVYTLSDIVCLISAALSICELGHFHVSVETVRSILVVLSRCLYRYHRWHAF